MSQDNEIISLIWPTWRDLILTPEHIITPCNNIPVDRLDLIVWKSHFYDRGMKETTKKLESMQILGPDIIQLMRIDHENHS